MTPLGRRLFKLSFGSGLFLSAPILFGVAWYAWSAFANLDRYRRAFDPKQKIDAELFQIALHDQLTSDLRRLELPERPAHGELPTLSLSLSRASLEALSDPNKRKSEIRYVPAMLEKDGRVHEVEVRYRGDQPWHALGEQKSLKVHLDKGDLIDGVRIFNLINDPTPFGLEDQIVLDLAREEGLLTPEYHPVRLRLNNHDLGVYRFEAQPDETLLRRSRRTPGNMYSGDSDEDGEPLFSGKVGWQKIAYRVADDEEDVELDRLVAAVARASHQDFAAYAEEELDLERMATFDALDVVFGGSEHDWFSNWKFYADPYRGKLEPVAWSFRGFQHELAFNAIDAPLLIRLKMTPGYLALRDRKVYELLTGKASVPSIRDRADRAMGPLAEELAADPYWDAYKLLPRASRFHRFYVRPMTLERWGLAAGYELEVFAERSRWLLDQLEEPGIEVRRSGQDGVARVDLTVSGHAAYRLESVRSACSGELVLAADADLNARFDPARDPVIARAPPGESAPITSHGLLAAGTVLVPHPDPKPKRGTVRADSSPATYTFFASADCPAVLLLESAVTGASLRIALAAPAEPVREVATSSSAGRAPRLIAGELAPHPWSFPQPPVPRSLVLGPGKVEVERTRTFGAHESVTIAAGTTIALGPGASLIFRGRVLAEGTVARPIALVRLDPSQPFGGIALQGPGTAGSRLVEVTLDGGSKVRAEKIDFSALINVHDTSDVELDRWTVTGDVDSGDVLHANTVERLSLHELTVVRAPVDAIDLEFVTADIRNLTVIGAGDDCLDLMGSKVRVQDSLITGCKHNGISAGEETELTVNRVVIADARTGILAKNASEARVIRSLLYRTERGLRARRKQVRYGGPSRIGTSEVFVAGSEVVHDADKGSSIEISSVRIELPGDGELSQVKEQVLGIATWSDLDRFLEALPELGVRP